jgi:predicted amidophosphoribosyltransferase
MLECGVCSKPLETWRPVCAECLDNFDEARAARYSPKMEVTFYEPGADVFKAVGILRKVFNIRTRPSKGLRRHVRKQKALNNGR